MIYIFTSQKGKDQIVKDFFIYGKKRISGGMQEWRCILKTCLAGAKSDLNYHQNLNSFVITKDHNHEPDYDFFTKKRLLEKIKENINVNHFNPRIIINSSLEGAQDTEIRALGKQSLLHRNLHNQRIKIINPLPYEYPDIKVSSILAKTHTNETFYQYGPNNYKDYVIHDGILILFSNTMANNLRLNNIWCIDGTFSIVPATYSQLLTIGFLRDHHVVPVVFGILSKKNYETYKNFFSLVANLIPNCFPFLIKVDFEYALINAIKFTYPNTVVSGCLFHLSQAIMRHLQAQGLSSYYKTDNNVKMFVKALYSLSYCKKEELINTFSELRGSALFPIFLNNLYDYFYNTYLKPNAKYPIDLWHCSFLIENNIPRTNNSIEGWHYAFKSTIGNSKNSFPLLFFKLKNEEDAARIKNIRIDIGETLERNRKYVNIETNLRLFLERRANNNYGFDFVQALTNILFF